MLLSSEYKREAILPFTKLFSCFSWLLAPPAAGRPVPSQPVAVAEPVSNNLSQFVEEFSALSESSTVQQMSPPPKPQTPPQANESTFLMMIYFSLDFRHFASLRHSIQGGPKMAQCIYMPITLSNINRFSKCFHCRNQEKMCNTITKDPTRPHTCCYTTWWNVRHCTQAGDDTDLLAWSMLMKPDLWPPNSPDLNRVDYAVWSVFQKTVYQCRSFTSNNQLKQAIVTEWSSRSIWLAASWLVASLA